MKGDELQVLLQAYQTARDLVATKEQALQTVLNWGAAMLIGATALVVGGITRDLGVALHPVLGWVVLVLVSAATTFQYIGESANLARLGAYAHRVEQEIARRLPSHPVPLYEHWSLDTQHWIRQQFGLSAVAWVLLAVLVQAVPFLLVSSATPAWQIYWAAGAVVSIAIPAAYGIRSSVQYLRATVAEEWSDAAAAKRRPGGTVKR